MSVHRDYYPEAAGQRSDLSLAGNRQLSLALQSQMQSDYMSRAGSETAMVRASQPIRLADGTIYQQNGPNRTWIYPEGSPVARIDIVLNADGSIAGGHWRYRSGAYTDVIKQGNNFIWKYPESSNANALSQVEKMGENKMVWTYRNGTVVAREGNRWLTQFGQGTDIASIEQKGDAAQTTVFTYRNGKEIVSRNDGYKSFTYPAGTAPAGLEAYRKIEILADGRMIWTKTDGSQIVKNGDTYTYPDGTTSGPGAQARPQVMAGNDNNPLGLRFENLAGGGRIGINQNNQVAFVDNGRGTTASYEYQNGKVVRVKSTDGTVWAIQGQDGNGNDLWIDNQNHRWVGRLTGVNRQGYAQYRQYDGLRFVMGPNGMGEVRNA